MNTPHERLTRTTFSLPPGELHDHPPTAVPFLEHLAETHRAVARPSRGHARDPAPGHLPALARLPEAVEEELVHGPVPAPRSRLSRAPPPARPDRSPVARLVAELHASTPRAVTSCTPISSAASPHRSSTTARSCARSRRSSIACARLRRTLQHPCCSSMAATTAASCRRPTRLNSNKGTKSLTGFFATFYS
jgi:hypothetical protein